MALAVEQGCEEGMVKAFADTVFRIDGVVDDFRQIFPIVAVAAVEILHNGLLCMFAQFPGHLVIVVHVPHVGVAGVGLYVDIGYYRLDSVEAVEHGED